MRDPGPVVDIELGESENIAVMILLGTTVSVSILRSQVLLVSPVSADFYNVSGNCEI